MWVKPLFATISFSKEGDQKTTLIYLFKVSDNAGIAPSHKLGHLLGGYPFSKGDYLSEIEAGERLRRLCSDTPYVTMSEPAYSQYRLDTLIAGAICAKAFASEIIPGKSLSPSQRNSKEAESEAGLYSCLESEGFALGIRPRCWFKPLLNL